LAYLILVRHGQSAWNVLGQWTGLTDVELTDEGKKEAQKAAETLRGIDIHKAHTSKLKRAHQTLEEIKNALDLSNIPVTQHEALNERDYGEYTSKNKWEVKEKIGDEEFLKLRRSWDYPVPGGESLKDVHSRVVPYYEAEILKDLKAGHNVIVTAHGNSLRALIKHLENIADEEISNLELGTGEVYLYEINESGKVISKEIKTTGKAT
jgi:2,3-bisphosphoglycerate-dependent phosphoglycerate mutase